MSLSGSQDVMPEASRKDGVGVLSTQLHLTLTVLAGVVAVVIVAPDASSAITARSDTLPQSDLERYLPDSIKGYNLTRTVGPADSLSGNNAIYQLWEASGYDATIKLQVARSDTGWSRAGEQMRLPRTEEIQGHTVVTGGRSVERKLVYTQGDLRVQIEASTPRLIDLPDPDKLETVVRRAFSSVLSAISHTSHPRLPKLGGGRLEPERYIPNSIHGVERKDIMPLEPSDRETLTGVQAASKGVWWHISEGWNVGTHLRTDVYVFDSAENAGRLTRCGFLVFKEEYQEFSLKGCEGRPPLSESSVARDTIAGLPVTIIHAEQATLEATEAQYAVSYQQGQLAIRVETSQIGTSVDDLRDAEEARERIHRLAKEAAHRAFRELVEEARAQKK